MGNGAPRIFLFTILVLALSLAPTGPAAAQGCGEQWVGRMSSVQGPSVQVRRSGDTRWLPVTMNETLCPGDAIRVGSRSRADLVLANQSLIRIDQNTELTLEAVQDQRTALLDLVKGAIHFLSRAMRGLEVRTPYTIAGVRGTEFLTRVEDGRTILIVYEGAVQAQNAAGSITLQGGQAAVAEAGQAPVLRVIARPRDAVQWALYYPPVVYAAPGPVVGDDARRLARTASELLAVGRVEEAAAEIERALSTDPVSAEALALQTIILIVGNQKERALDVSERAVKANPDSATARIALSYAQQAGFNLEGARNSLEEAVALDPANALAWARLAELHMSLGYLDRALQAARKAWPRIPTCRAPRPCWGMPTLRKSRPSRPVRPSTKPSPSTRPTPCRASGWGLPLSATATWMKADGRSRSPRVSIRTIRSSAAISGKPTTRKSAPDRTSASTPLPRNSTRRTRLRYFYDAIAKQTTNRPVEALQDYQKAIELNDNRAVYRSRLQLDSDLAARSAALARIYSDLGFQQRALAEGYNSVNIDPTDFSAHRFLADSYSVLPRHEIARVSELLQSQLLQPINITPIQPGWPRATCF